MFLITIKKRKWDELLDAAWLPKGEIQADPLGDLHPSEGSISIWWVDEQLLNLDDIIVALALTRDKWDIFEYGLFDSSIPGNLGLLVKETIGKTPLPQINHFHRDLVELTVDKYVQFIKGIFPQVQKERAYRDDIWEKVREARNKHLIDANLLNKKIRPLYDAL